ncbi:helix-turn-helix transcriptional regulator [Bifidobacterium favimelis]|uniref:AraC family transcriptional regulator n=1 Tax=Bifidobacterium favimelis TaxID=3122979 RepID=A0ABU8ZPI0_9BIFI
MPGNDGEGIGRRLRPLYHPQMDQLGIRLRPEGRGWSGPTGRPGFRGRAWVSGVGPDCLVVRYDITFLHDTEFVETSPCDYACAWLSGPDDDTPPTCLPPNRVRQEAGLYSCIQPAGLTRTFIPGGSRRQSTSINLLPAFFDDLDRDWPGEFSGLDKVFLDTWKREAASATLEALSWTGPSCGTGQGLMLESRIRLMVSMLAGNAEGKGSTGSRGPDPHRDRPVCDQDRALVEELQAYVDDHLGGDLSLDRVARACYVGRTRLCSTFRARTGTTFAAYVRRRRMEEACHLLSRTNEDVGQVGRRVGYPQPGTFSTAFARELGSSPIRWRSDHRLAQGGAAFIPAEAPGQTRVRT